MIRDKFFSSISPNKSLGFGHFTSFLIEKDAFNQHYVRGLNLHFARLLRASKKLDIFCPSSKEVIEQLKIIIATNNESTDDNDKLSQASSLRIKITVWQDGWNISKQSYNPHNPTAFRLVMVEGGRPLPELKSCSSCVSILAQQFADKSGYNTALLMQGSEVLEAAWGNIIWISKKAGKLMYRTEGVLSGVAQTLITQNYPYEVMDCKFTLNDLYENASAVFFCNAVRGVIPVTQINEWNVPQCDRHIVEITKVWQKSEVIRIS